MKQKTVLKFAFLCLVLMMTILSFGLINKNSYALDNEEEHTQELVNTSKNTSNEVDDKIRDFLSNADDFAFDDLSLEAKNIILAEPSVVKEDPSLEIKKNASVKGKAKKTTAKKAVQKYETNETSLGIDVSTWQGTIDWKKVKQSGINFAMIRCGFRGMESGKITMDSYFLKNIKGAIANNINVGVYFFSMAKNKKEAEEEAKWVVNLIKDYDISYPVAIDTEIFNKYRLKGVSYSTLTDNAIAFSNYVKSKGYTPMIYSYLRAFNQYFDTAKFSKYRIWLAQYNDEATYKGRYYMWQYTSSGSVPGIKGRVDMNVSYFSVTNDATKRSIVNGIYKPGNLADVVFKDLEMNTVLTKDVNLRISPYTTIPNKAGILEKGTKIKVIGLGEKWVKIQYENNTYYINDVNCFEMKLKELSFTDVNLTVKVNKVVQVLYKPYDFLFNNEYKKLNIGDEVVIIGTNNEYVKVLIDDKEYYVNDLEFYDILNDNIYHPSS